MPSSRGSSHLHCTVHGILQVRVLECVAFPSSRDLPNPGIEPRFPTLQVDSLPAEPQGKPIYILYIYIFFLFYVLFHCKLLQDIKYNFMCYTVGPCWLSTSYIVMCTC